jgi:glycosyltransferase involved in cell wall biosynthesis
MVAILAVGTAITVNPLLTVITPCLNAAATIGDTLSTVATAAAVLERDGHQLEHWIIDGGSSDDTAGLVEAHRRDRPWCRWLSGVVGGPYAGMNAGLERARGHYSHVLNADDLLLDPELYARTLAEAHRSDALVLLASIAYFRRPGLRIRHLWQVAPLPEDRRRWQRELRRGLHYPHPGFVAVTELYRQEGFDGRFSLAADYHLMQKLLLQPALAHSVAVQPRALVAMAEGGRSSGWRSIRQGRRQLAVINRELGIEGSPWRRYAPKVVQRLRARWGRHH